jgi:hypothetical protein
MTPQWTLLLRQHRAKVKLAKLMGTEVTWVCSRIAMGGGLFR